MSTIPEIRKNIKFFANGKNKPLVQLATMVADTEVVLAVLEVTPPSEYNTCLKVRRDLYPLLPIDSYDVPFDSRFRERNIMYDRINISTALAIEFARDESGNFDLDDETFYQHPLQLEDVVEVLNNKYGYDVTADDITITYTSSNNYTITAQPNSLQYFGQASVNIGTDDDTPPPVKVPSHDSVWDTTIIDKSTPVSVNGVAVPSTDLAALYTAGLALVQFNDPDMAWVVWTGTLPGEAIFRTTSVDPKISNTNVNQTLTITGQNLFGKYVPFTPNATIPPFNNQVNVAVFAQSMFFTVPYVPTLDRMVNVWIDNVKTTFAALTSAEGVNGLKLVIQPNGDTILAHDGVRTQRVQMRVNIATLPALVRSNSRFIYGIQRGGNNLPLDSMGHEVYNLNFPMKEIVVPDPSTVTPIIPDKAEDFIAALDKIASGLVLPYSTYKSANPTISNVSGRLTLSATVESETQEPRFPAFYFIKEADWLHIQTLPVSTTLGSFNLASTPPAQVPVTVGYLTGSVVPVDGGRLFCMVHDIPMHMNGSFVLDYDPAGEDYVNTTTNLRFDVTYSKASLISPAQANENILRRIATTTSDMSPEAIDRMIVRQQEVDRFVNQINSQWYVNFEFIPYNPPELTEESLDSNGRYVLQLMAIPALAMVQIQGIAARKPEAIIIRVTDTGGLNTENITALQINQTAVIDDETGIGYLLMRHNKSSSSSNIRWTFRCDYDEMDAIYRETATIVNITDSVIDNPVVPFNGISIQECSTEVQYDQFKAIVGAADASLQFLTWDEQDLLIASDSRTGIFTKYGLETPARSTVGRLLIPSEQSNWIRNGDFDQFPEKDPVIVRATNTTTGETYDINMSYLRANVNRAGGIPIRLPAFDDDNRLNQWTFNFKWFGYGNPARPAPSPLPNLIDGSVNPAIQCETKPFRELDSLFNFTSQYIGQEADVMRANLIRNGWSLPATETVIKQKDITVNADYKPSGSQEFWGRNTQRLEVDWNVVTPTHLYMQVIAIDDEIMAGFLGGTFTEAELDTVIFTRATDGGLGTTKEVTLRHIRLNGVNASGRGLIPVVSSLNRVGAFENPAQASFNWKANFVSLNGGGNIYLDRNLTISNGVYMDNDVAPVINLKGITGSAYLVDVAALAAVQWPGYDFALLEDLDITANNNFGVWNVGFINKGKFGYEVLEFDSNAIKFANTCKTLGITSNILRLSVTSIDNYNFTANFTATQFLDKLAGGTLITIPVKAALVRGEYEIKVNATFEGSGTTTQFSPVAIRNVTTVKDGTPEDITVNARWTVPATQTELNTWNVTVGLGNVLLTEYGMVVTQYDYTHNVIVEQSGVEYVAAIAIDKTVRERLIENRYPDNTIVGIFNGENLLAGDLINGLQDTAGDSIILARAPINLTQNRFGLSFSISGIADYNKIFTGTDKPVVIASDVLTTKIQKDLGKVIENLRAALNPVADTLLTIDDIHGETISENASTVTNVLNGISRNHIGKNWLIPVAIEVTQMEYLTPGTWTVIRVNGTTLVESITTEQLTQFRNEGWEYTDTETGKVYAIYPILNLINDTDGVVKRNWNVNAGMSVGRWAPWFTNYVRTVNLEYSLEVSKISESEVMVPGITLYDQLASAGVFSAVSTINVRDFTREVDLVGDGLNTVPWDFTTTIKDANKYAPVVVRWPAAIINSLPNGTAILSTLEITAYLRDLAGQWLENGKRTLTFNKGQILTGMLVNGFYYKVVGFQYTDLVDRAETYTLTSDYDGADSANWVSSVTDTGLAVTVGIDQLHLSDMSYAGGLIPGATENVTILDRSGVKTNAATLEETIGALNTVYGLEVYNLPIWGE